MHRTDIDDTLADVLVGRRLLAHPFYRRWEAGTLAPGELGAYAAQYRHFEAALPGVLERVASHSDEPGARALVEANLADERGAPAHIELFDGFAAAVGAGAPGPMTPATTALVGLYDELADGPAVAALAALAAYEVQSAEIAASKADGLRARYGLDGAATRFWDVHAAVDQDHGAWIVGALAALGAGAEDVRPAAHAAAGAWWAFLDEREAAAPPSAS
ncbi:MAG TPA: iron-containing redox enzyme family protein [Acidimicrobiales bacterium]|nr:iron-containing redox enzyme family protein [Acidimicrobiales bacterium]